MNLKLLVNEIPKLKVIRTIEKNNKEENLILTGDEKFLWKIFSKFSNSKITKFSFNDKKKTYVIEYVLSEEPNKLNLYTLRTISNKDQLNLSTIFKTENISDLKKEFDNLENEGNENV